MAQKLRLDTVPIRNAESYNAEMAKSLLDKAYFLDKTDATLFVDYGCANGALLGFIDRMFPDVVLIGYDTNPEMIEIARRENPGSARPIQFTDSWLEIDRIMREHGGRRSCLVLSSVIHEAYSYMKEDEVTKMWANIWGERPGGGPNFDYIAIRDMMVSRTTSRPSDPLSVARVRQVFDPYWIDRWEAHWGSLEENWSLTHFFLTYRYLQIGNERELHENYLPINLETFLSQIPNRYYPIFKEHFTLPFLRRRVREDFGVELADRTHIKLVLESASIRDGENPTEPREPAHNRRKTET